MRSAGLTGEDGEGVEERCLDASSPLVGGRGRLRFGSPMRERHRNYTRGVESLPLVHQYNRLRFTLVLTDPWKKFVVDESGGLEHHLKGGIRVC
jgi:hypothetical protein